MKECKTCNPCGDCQYMGKNVPECEFCDPCGSVSVCSYCGNGFVRCDIVEETEEGPMHISCFKKYYKLSESD